MPPAIAIEVDGGDKGNKHDEHCNGKGPGDPEYPLGTGLRLSSCLLFRVGSRGLLCGQLLRGFQLRLATPFVFRTLRILLAPGCQQELATSIEPFPEAGFRGELLDLGQALAHPEPCLLGAASPPVLCSLLQCMGQLQILALDLQPVGQLLPLTQKGLVGDFDDFLAVALVDDQQALFSKGGDESVTFRWQIVIASEAAQRLVGFRIDRGEPGDEGRVEAIELGGAFGRIPSEHGIDFAVHHAVHAAHGFVFIQAQIAIAAVIPIQPRQRQRQQRQRVRTVSTIAEQAFHKLRFDLKPVPRHGGAVSRAGDDLLELLRRHRFQAVEYRTLQSGQFAGGLQRLITVRPDRERDNQRRPLRAGISQGSPEQRQETTCFIRGVRVEQFLGLIYTEEQRGRREVFAGHAQSGASGVLDLDEQLR